MKCLKLLKRDFVLGTLRSWFKFLIVILLALAQIIILNHHVDYGLEEGYLFHRGTIMDYLMYIMQGMRIYRFDPTSYFEVPIYWFVFQIGISYICAYYPEKDYRESGIKVFLSVGSKSPWWIAKCIWAMCNVILYFTLLVISTLIFAGLSGAEISWKFSEQLAVFFFGSNVLYLESGEVLILVIILPCLMTIAFIMVQMLLSFLLSPVISFAAMCGMYVLSAYYTTWMLAGNFTMWLRSAYVEYGGVLPQSGFFIGGFLIILSILAGSIYFEKKDVL